MTAVNLQMMPSNMPLDFLPTHPQHSRSNSVSSSSTHSSHSRPQSSHGGMNRIQQNMGPSAEDIYRATYHLGHQGIMHNDPVSRFSFVFIIVSGGLKHQSICLSFIAAPEP